ncbi:hypothetical protein E4U32_004721 [Claviceps aff. humidiphila group G2b]|nr:hypothetical protein E4U32_004721 [Claviceps aff. humidiphila group G2b]
MPIDVSVLHHSSPMFLAHLSPRPEFRDLGPGQAVFRFVCVTWSLGPSGNALIS